MKTQTLLERHSRAIKGTLECFDRVLLAGTYEAIGWPGAMLGYLCARGIDVREFATRWANPWRVEINRHIRAVAREEGGGRASGRAEGAQGRGRGEHSRAARPPAWSGLRVGSDGALPQFSCGAKAERRLGGGVGPRPLPALLHLPHRPGGWALPFTRADVGSFSAPVLLQRARLAGEPAQSRGAALPQGRQLLYPRAGSPGGAEARPPV